MEKLKSGDLVRLIKNPERGPLLVLRTEGEKVMVKTDNGFKRFRNDPSKFEPISEDELPANSPVVDFRDAERASLIEVPERLHKEIRRLWYLSVSGGGKRHDASGDRSALESQEEISSLLKREGISKNSKTWKAVNEFGHQLYYESK